MQALSTRDEPAADVFGKKEAIAGSESVWLFSGTFNPLTLAHIALVRSAGRLAGAHHHMLWLLAVASIEKESVARATLVDRLAHLLAYVATEPHSSVVVVNRGLYVDQVALLRSQLHIPSTLVVLVGFDKIVQIFDPHYYQDRHAALDELFSQARFVVAPRGRAASAELDALLSRPDNQPYQGSVSYLPTSSQYREDSATEARRLASQPGISKSALGRLLPPEGVALVLRTGAYATPSTSDLPDSYFWRRKWITALGQALPAVRTESAPSLPHMDALCRAAMAMDDHGQRLRASLLADPPRTEELLSLLAVV
jgi:nicotinic acid mononucleotide adenylyltransferase